jgi:hypothetical protein
LEHFDGIADRVSGAFCKFYGANLTKIVVKVTNNAMPCEGEDLKGLVLYEEIWGYRNNMLK